MLKYIKEYNTFVKETNNVNEGIIGNLINLFKKMFDSISKDLESLGANPDIDKVKNYLTTNPFASNGKSFLFRQLLSDFQKKPTVNQQDCLDLIKNCIDPKVGVLGINNLNTMVNDLSKEYGDNKALPITIQYMFETVRNATITKFKYAGGPNDGNTDDKKITVDLKDMNHLPDLKKILTNANNDSKKMQQGTLDFFNKTMLPYMVSVFGTITSDGIDKYLKSKNIEMPKNGVNYDILKDAMEKKSKIVYLLKDKTKDDYNKLSDDAKKAPETNEDARQVVGVKELADIDSKKNDNEVIFNDRDGKPTIIKTYDQLIGVAPQEQQGGNDEDLQNIENTLKEKPDLAKNTKAFIDFVSNDANKDKLDDLYKMIGNGGEGEQQNQQAQQ